MTLRKILLLGLSLRIILVPFTYHGDAQVNYLWGRFANEIGTKGYYDWLNFGPYTKPDQPPLYISFYTTLRIIYLPLYQIVNHINQNVPIFPSNFATWFEEHGNQQLQKLPIILSDLLLIYLLYLILIKIDKKAALLGSFVLSIYPPLLYNTAVWGGNDSLTNLLGLASLYALSKKKFNLFTILITLCLLFKVSWIVFIPGLLILYIKQKPSNLTLLKNLSTSLLLIAVNSIPYTNEKVFIWIYTHYLNTYLGGTLNQLTSNAFNLWGAIYGLTPINDDLHLLFGISARIISVVLFIIVGGFLTFGYLKQKNNFDPILGFFNYQICLGLAYFNLLTRMHERYTFPILIPLLILSLLYNKYRPYFLLFTLLHMLNVYHNWWYPQFNILVNILKIDQVERLLSTIILLLSALFIYKFSNYRYLVKKINLNKNSLHKV